MKKGIQALIVDDESHFRLLLRRIFTHIKIEIIDEAKSGEEAVELFRALRPDITLMDINMSGMNGIETLEEIRKIDGDAFVVMLSSLTTRKMVEQSVDSGATYFIRKDIPVNEIESLIKELLIKKGLA